MFDRVRRVEQRKHWWNGSWGRLARRDVFLRTDADRWYVEARTGGAEGASRFTEYATEETAYDAVRHLLAGPGGWREVSAGRSTADDARELPDQVVSPPARRGTGHP
ncbi:hypothetical protein [Micromonospora sp. NBC_01813]|uniref:hypothetical protein n=1 Tax=Micromonospora sp. NBC_01813 TaxID=2975988 RepID=UPI002DDC1FEB|nr:hypothetical protein [Micromonospora sp. NBC_01813]WSA07780.1 hypothetical protein OG958_26705 [Micromonospora sp. NBC_01813]